ncbi:MAG: hypothetical protein AAF645_05550 [Myxococcota bacterium]
MNRALLLLALPIALSGACTRAVTTEIRNPLHAGVVDENHVAIAYGTVERQRGLPPGALDDAASMTRLDSGAVCFDVDLHGLEEDGVAAITDHEIHVDVNDDVRVVSPDIEVRPIESQVYQGLNPVEVQSGFEERCIERVDDDDRNSPCVRVERVPTYTTEYHPGPVAVYGSAGSICFAHGGEITTETGEVRLVLHRTAFNLRFEWRFSPLGDPQP